MIRIYADFNSVTEDGWVVLNTVGSLGDIAELGEELVSGARVLLYVPDELEVEGVLKFDRVWFANPDWSTLRYLDKRDETDDGGSA